MDDENKQPNTRDAKSFYSTVISYLNCNEEYEFNNFSFKNYLGTKLADIDKTHIKDVVGKDIYQKIKPYLDKALSGEEQQFEFEWKQAVDAPPHLFHVIYTPDIDDEGNVRGIHIVSNDVSAEQQKKLLKESEERLQFAMDATGDGVWDWNVKTGEVIFSEKWYLSLGYEFDETEQNLTFWKQVLHPDDEESTANKVKAYFDKKTETYVHENRLRKRSGEYRHNLARGRVVEWDKEGNPLRMIGIDTDISQIKQTEFELHKLSRAVEASSCSVIITNCDGNIEYVNPKFSEVSGYTKAEVIGQNPRMLQSGDTDKSVYIDLWETIKAGEEWRGEFCNKRKDGSLCWERASISGVKNDKGEMINFIAIQEDVTHEYELKQKLNYQASHDSLTGLINRYEFEQRLDRLLLTIKQDKTEHTLCFMDLDQFKVVNDTCGHVAGDTLLNELSVVLQKNVRKRDSLARLGGDEFGILMEQCSLDQAQRVAKSIQKTIQDYQFSWRGHHFKLGVSMGLVSISESSENLSKCLSDVDIACYMAKSHGRNRIHVYHADDSETMQHHGDMQWVERINQALKEDNFCLYAQTIMPLDNCDDVHYEFLIRMKDDEGKVILPGEFLPTAERYNLITQLDCWVVKQTFILLLDNPVFLKQINFISINLSGQSFADETFLSFVIAQLQKSGIDGRKICFEITETAAISNLNEADKFIAEIRQYGCRFALDDFGSGLSSFAYLKNLPVDYLKIDGMFVKDITDDPIDHAMVKSINEIGQVMGMQTIAEFVEKDETKGMLKAIGVNHAQGYGIGKPLAVDELLLRSNNVSSIEQAENI